MLHVIMPIQQDYAKTKVHNIGTEQTVLAFNNRLPIIVRYKRKVDMNRSSSWPKQ